MTPAKKKTPPVDIGLDRDDGVISLSFRAEDGSNATLATTARGINCLIANLLAFVAEEPLETAEFCLRGVLTAGGTQE